MWCLVLFILVSCDFQLSTELYIKINHNSAPLLNVFSSNFLKILKIGASDKSKSWDDWIHWKHGVILTCERPIVSLLISRMSLSAVVVAVDVSSNLICLEPGTLIWGKATIYFPQRLNDNGHRKINMLIAAKIVLLWIYWAVPLRHLYPYRLKGKLL